MMVAPKPHRSIRGKLDRLVFVSVGVALIAAALLNVWHEADRYLASKRETLLAVSEAFGAASSKAVAAGDAVGAVQGLRAIGGVPGLVRAEVSGRDGALLAEMGDAVRLGGDLNLDEEYRGFPIGLLTSRTIQTSTPIRHGGEIVGRIRVISDTSDLAGRFQSTLLAAPRRLGGGAWARAAALPPPAAFNHRPPPLSHGGHGDRRAHEPVPAGPRHRDR